MKSLSVEKLRFFYRGLRSEKHFQPCFILDFLSRAAERALERSFFNSQMFRQRKKSEKYSDLFLLKCNLVRNRKVSRKWGQICCVCSVVSFLSLLLLFLSLLCKLNPLCEYANEFLKPKQANTENKYARLYSRRRRSSIM